MNLYQQQNADTFTDIGINTANPNRIASDITLTEKIKGEWRLSGIKQLVSGPYKFDGQGYSLRGAS